jgi:uncharacterized protein (TIGR02145 family)
LFIVHYSLFIEKGLLGISSSILISSVTIRRPFFYNYELEITNEKNKLLTKKGINMKTNLLLMMMCAPIILAAQNGINVSGLSVDARTVTFNVSWKNADMTMLWSDTVWVFVDYNKNGVMERLPVTGATASAGTVTKIPNNDKGVWVEGNARTNGNFSATVQLFTTVSSVGGACAYASNYPPVGEYITAQTIKFTGTPPYGLVLSSGSATACGDYNLLSGQTLESFTDMTGAPGIMKRNCHAPGATNVTFAAFDPCASAPTASTWTLTDTRDGKTYKVKLLADGRYWMVQDLQFGDLCNKNFAYPWDGAPYIDRVNTSGTYYGACKVGTSCSNPGGYFYNWMATVNSPDARYGSITYPGCSGITTSVNACRGICPENWHVPTTAELDDSYRALQTSLGCSKHQCWTAVDPESVFHNGEICNYSGEDCFCNSWNLWTSTPFSATFSFRFGTTDGYNWTGAGTVNAADGYLVRCTRNI